MKYLKQVVIILFFTMLGELLSAIIPFPIPAAIYGMVLLLIALLTGLLKEEHISDTANFLISIMPAFFVAPSVRLLEYWGLIAPHVAAILTISVTSTLLVFAVAGLVTQALLKRKEKKNA